MHFFRRLFGAKKPTIESLQFTADGWQLPKQHPQQWTWAHPSLPARLSLHFFDLPPDLPATLPDLTALRQHYRQSLSQQGGGLLEVSYDAQPATPVVRTIFKVPAQPQGLLYAGSLIVPFRDCSYVIKVQAREAGATGLRETVVAEQLLQRGQLQLTDAGLENWAADPYDPTFTAGNLMNQSEQPEYDAPFPDHPLSLVRRTLRTAAASLQLQPELRAAPRFPAP
jgi:hypothetical protein